jgi:hypothetical protein
MNLCERPTTEATDGNQKEVMPRCWFTARTLKTSLIWRRCLTSDSASFSLFSSSTLAISRFRT